MKAQDLFVFAFDTIKYKTRQIPEKREVAGDISTCALVRVLQVVKFVRGFKPYPDVLSISNRFFHFASRKGVFKIEDSFITDSGLFHGLLGFLWRKWRAQNANNGDWKKRCGLN